jgi:ferritin-like protein
MAESSATFHESEGRLTPATRDMHRAIVSLMEELEAVDWYQQRMDATDDPELRDILRHNRDEEKEHAAMVLEWIRRRDRSFETKLREYLFTEGSIVGREEVLERAAAGAADGAGAAPASVGSLRGGR